MISNEPTKKAAQTLTDILLKLKAYTAESINVAEVAQVISSFTEHGQTLYKCELIGNAGVTIICDKIREVDVSDGLRVVILFTDTDFRNSLLKIRSGGKNQNYVSTDLHSTSYGIIIGSIG